MNGFVKHGSILIPETVDPYDVVGDWVVTATLYDTVTRLRGEYVASPNHNTLETIWFMWTDGNYGCDCNRGSNIATALELPDGHELWDLPCGSNRIVMESLIVKETGDDLVQMWGD